MRIAVFWAVAPCSLAEIDRSFRGGVSIIALMLEETSVNFFETTRHNFPEDSHIHGDSIFLLYVSTYKSTRLTTQKTNIDNSVHYLLGR
jgi:hypothetical protein